MADVSTFDSKIWLADAKRPFTRGRSLCDMEAKMNAKNPLFFGMIDILLAGLALVSAAALLAAL